MPAKTYSQCPKCGHASLPADQSLPASCPACGLVLAKYAQIQADAKSSAALLVKGEEPLDAYRREDDQAWLASIVFNTPSPVNAANFWARVALFAFFAVWGLRLIALDYREGEMGESFLHGPLLVFHEAGHVIFRILGEFMMFLGGTLGQLLMPVILMGALLLKNRDPFGASIGLWLLGVSFLDVAPYVYDALYPQLMLLSGTTGEEGGHDWIYLLNAMGLLKKAHGLGWFFHKLGAAIVLLAIAWGSVLLWRQYKVHSRNDESAP